MNTELEQWLHEKGIATSRMTPYNPQGNGQIERYSGIIYKTTELSIKSKGLPSKHWEVVLSEALYSIRSLINMTLLTMNILILKTKNLIKGKLMKVLILMLNKIFPCFIPPKFENHL